MNQCCKDILSKLQKELADNAQTLIKLSGKRELVMEEAMYRRAEIIVDIMGLVKEFAQRELKK